MTFLLFSCFGSRKSITPDNTPPEIAEKIHACKVALKTSKDLEDQVNLYLSMSEIYLDAGLYENAQKYARKARDHWIKNYKQNKPLILATTYKAIIEAYLADDEYRGFDIKKNAEQAIEYYRAAGAGSKSRHGEALIWIHTAAYCLKHADKLGRSVVMTKASHYLGKIPESMREDYTPVSMAYWLAYAKLKEAEGDLAEALAASEEAANIKLVLKNTEYAKNPIAAPPATTQEDDGAGVGSPSMRI